jgi:chromosome segregation ATPase
MANLYELTAQFRELQDMLNGPDTDEQMIKDTLEGLEYELEEKAENYARVIRNLESDINGYKAEEKRMADRRRTLENNIQRMKDNLQNSMMMTGKVKFKTQHFTFGIQNNPPHVQVEDEGKIPESYFIPQVPILDKQGLMDALKGGAEIEGVTLVQTQGLRIR